MDETIAVVAFLTAVSLPLVLTIISRHQQRMAEILQQARTGPQEAALREEVAQLRQIVAQQTIMLDTLSQSQRELASRLAPPDDVRQRLASGQG